MRTLCLSIGFGLFALSPTELLAQDVPLPNPVTPEKPTRKALEGQATTAANAAELDMKLKLRAQKRAQIQKRVAEIHAKQADFLKKVSQGKLLTFPNVRKAMPEIIRQIDGIKHAYKGIVESQAKDLPAGEQAKLREVEKAIYKTMQFIGPFLAHADPRQCDQNLTATELKTLQKLDKEDRQTGGKELPELELISEELAYTLHFIPAPIKVKSTPNTAIYFEAVAGGQFKALHKNTTGDNLPLAKVITDKDGYAEIAWFSEGDSIGYMEVIISSPKASNFKVVSVQVQQLLPQPIADFLNIKNKLPKKSPITLPRATTPSSPQR